MEKPPELFSALGADASGLGAEQRAYFRMIDGLRSGDAGTDRRPRPAAGERIVDRVKRDLCRQFVRYTSRHRINQRELARQLCIDEARVSEIMRYRVNRLKTDRLLNYLERLEPVVDVRFRIGGAAPDSGAEASLG